MLRLGDAALGAVLLDANPGAPVAIISGEGVAELQRRYAGLPIAGSLAKPFKDVELTALIGALARGVVVGPEPAVRAPRAPSANRVPGPRA